MSWRKRHASQQKLQRLRKREQTKFVLHSTHSMTSWMLLIQHVSKSKNCDNNVKQLANDWRDCRITILHKEVNVVLYL